jgi:hypothetical protein
LFDGANKTFIRRTDKEYQWHYQDRRIKYICTFKRLDKCLLSAPISGQSTCFSSFQARSMISS